MSKLKNSLIQQKQQTEQYNQKFPGILGIPLGGQRVVEVAGRNSYVYIRLRNSQSEVIQAFNNRVAPSYNLPVIVERQGNRYVVLDVDTQRYDNNWGSFSPYLARHGNTHSFDIESGGGGDIVWVYPRQFMPLLAFPSGSVGSPNVIVSPYTLRKENGTWMYVGNTGTASFAPYNPLVSGSAVMGLIVLNTDTGNPYFLIGSGTPMASSLTGSSQVYPYIPTLTNPLHVPIAAIRLISGTSRLTWDNIYDVRQFVHGHVTGSAGGLSSVAVRDEGVPQGNVTTFDFIGAPVSVSVSGSVAQVTVSATASGSSSATFTGSANSVVLTDSSGNLNTPSWLKWGGSPGAQFVEFGADKIKESNAGKMGYEAFGAGFMFFVGAGSGSERRKFKFFDDVYVDSDLYVNGGQRIYADKQVTNGDSHDHSGGDGAQINHTSLASIGTNTHDQIDAFIAGNQASNDIRYGRIDGWQIHTGTWTRQSADDPNYVAAVNPYTAGVIFVGMKVDLFQNATDKYFFVQKIETTGSVGYLTLYGGTDYALTTGSISSSKYSFDKVPVGFPISPDKWTVSLVSDTSNASQSTPTGSIWYNLGSLGGSIPIGSWRVYYEVAVQVTITLGAAANVGFQSTLSTANNSESDSDFTASFTSAMPALAGAILRSTVHREKLLNILSKTPYFLNAFTGTSGVTTLAFRGDVITTTVKCVCAYL